MKPKLTEAPDGNIFAVLGACQRVLRRHDADALAAFQKEVDEAANDGKTDYHGMLAICMKHVHFDFMLEDEIEEDDEIE